MYRLTASICFIFVSISVVSGQDDSPQKSRRVGIRHNEKVVKFIPQHVRKQRAQERTHAFLEQADAQHEVDIRSADHETIVGIEDDFLEPADCDCDACVGECGLSCFGDCQNAARVRLTTQAEYLYWWTKGMNAPALATTSPVGTIQDEAGVLGQTGTSILFGGDELNSDGRSGVRLNFGLHLEGFERNGLEFSFVGLEEGEESYADSSINQFILARPFFNVQLDREDSRFIGFPNLVSGTLSIHSSTKFHTLNVHKNVPLNCLFGLRADPFFGYRYASLEDSISLNESTVSLASPTLDSMFDLTDQFSTENQFHGGEFGLRFRRHCHPCWSFDLLTKVALGNTNSRASISGQTTTTVPNTDPTTINAGLLAQSTNSGTFEIDEFSTILDISLSLRRHSLCGITTSIGYSFFFWSDVARASELIDPNVNPTQIPPQTLTGEARPAFDFNSSDFWAQGLNFGIEYKW